MGIRLWTTVSELLWHELEFDPVFGPHARGDSLFSGPQIGPKPYLTT